MQIEEVEVSKIIPYENNPRRNDAAVDYVAQSIKDFGFRVPIIVDKSNIIIAGHTRLKAALKLNLETVPVIRAENLTEDQVTAFRLVDNKTAELSHWDNEKLIEEIEKLSGLDMSVYGFDEIKEIDYSEFFGEAEEVEKEKKEKEPELVTCPFCGHEFEAKGNEI
jgi:ParB-like chromosome segregation protein Spo0J